MYCKIKKPSILCLFLVCFIFGCAQYPKKETTMTNPSLQESTKNALTSSLFTQGEWPSREWWEIFKDPQLSILIQNALEENPTIQIAQARLVTAQQNARMVKASLFPKLDANYLERWQYFSKNGFVRDFFQLPPGAPPIASKMNYLSLDLKFYYEFDFWGKNRKQFSAALGQAKAELAERIQSELTISSLVAFSYFEYQKHKQEEILQHKICNYMKDLSTLYKNRSTYGVSNNISVLDAQRDYLEAQKKLLEAQKNAQIDLYVLRSLLGKGPDVELNLTVIDLNFDSQVPLPANLGADLLARRADLVALIWRAESASKEVGVAKTDFYPNINLMALGGLESLQFPTLFSWSSREGALQPAIHLPIFSAGKISANVSSKIGKYNEAIQRYNEGLLNAVKEIASELTTLTTLSEQLQLQENIVEMRTEKENLFNSRYAKGLDNQTTLLNAQQENVQAQLYKIELQNYKMLSIVRLIKALGGGYESDTLPSIVKKG
ncbi:MAG: efflux transporter outer membrane subunit [Chlamydiae bacterium]|nr:efflux transporter outer membrane subunit [Chlamydiota bacterium]